MLLAACGRPDAAETSNATATSSTAAATSDSVQRSQSALDGAVKADEPGCSAAVGVEGKVVWAGVRGVANLATGAKITTDTVFDIASVSKQFTATAILLLADEGRLTLDDPLSDHVPGLPAWATTVTVAQLMHQTSGIPDYIVLLQDAGNQYSDPTTQEQAVQALAGVSELEFNPGARFEYSNSNYLLLAEIVRLVSGEPLPAFLNAEIFRPLDLAMVMDPGANIGDKAESYDRDDSGSFSVAGSAWLQIGDGAIQTTPSQLVRWADNYRTGKVGGHQLLDAQLAGAVDTDSGSDDRYGAGIYLLPDGGLVHDGSWAGFVTAFHISEDRRTSVAVSCNAGDQDPEAITEDIGQSWM